jgi:hypothetical protein
MFLYVSTAVNIRSAAAGAPIRARSPRRAFEFGVSRVRPDCSGERGSVPLTPNIDHQIQNPTFANTAKMGRPETTISAQRIALEETKWLKKLL